MAKKKHAVRMLDRDVSWMYFNRRILQEAQRDNVPLLERFTFLGIYSNNLDEFYRVRVSALKRVVEYEEEPHGGQTRATALRELRLVEKLTKVYLQEFEETFERLKTRLKDQHIYLIDETQLSDSQARYIKMVYRNDLNSSTYPLITTQGSRLGDLTDSGIYLAVKLLRTGPRSGKTLRDFALIELPTREFGRFIVLPPESGRTCIMFLDDVVRFCLPFIFAGLHYDSFEAYTFKFTRDAEIELDSGIGVGLVEQIARGVKNRRKGEPVRLVYDKQMPRDMLRHIRTKLRIDRFDTSDAGSRYHNMKDLIGFPSVGRSDLKFPPQPPVLTSPFETYGSALEAVRTKDRFLHYPYHSFSNYIRLLREAALSRDVRSIKTTVYRLAKDSKVVKALICAARHGKEVTVVVELMARFDESSNISWSKKMQDAGIHVLFGVEGLKVHSKLTHISSPKGDIACISTGNFHEGNAKLYTDTTLFTADRRITREVDAVFDFIRHPYRPVVFRQLLVSPQGMRFGMDEMIDTEIAHAQAGRKAYILCKVNHITDDKIIRRLYEASAAGVQLRMLVRGNCSVIPGIPGLSENIEIRGIIDRYLEHSRIFIFCNGGRGRERYFIGSADWMTRNLDHRVEVYAPVHDRAIQAELRRIIEYGLRDNVAARVVDGTGENRLYENDLPPFRSQSELYRFYTEQANEQLTQREHAGK